MTTTASAPAPAGSFRTPVNNTEGPDYELPPTGTCPAVLVALVDLGSHSQVFNGQASESRRLLLAWELTAEADSKGENFVVIAEFTWSLHKKSKLRPLVESWLGQALAEGDFDLGTLLGQPCLLSLAEGTSAGGKRFVEVAGISRPMRGLVVPPASRPLFAFTLEGLTTAENPPVPVWMPPLYGKSVVDKIKASREFAALSPF